MSRLTIDEAIAQEIELYEIAKDRYKTLGLENCKRFAEEHKQYAEWLEELKMLRIDSCMIHMPERLQLVENGYNKAIDDFVKACKEDIVYKTFGLRECDIERISKQLKVGGENDKSV